MAAANPQPHITLKPFRGKADENWPDFESLLKSLINVGNIPNANRPQFLQLHLLDQALQFFRTLPQATRDNFDAAITALRNHYCNPNLRELHKLQLHNLKFDHKHGSPEDFLVQVQIKATQAYPDPVLPPIPPANPPNEQAEIDRVQNAQEANQAVLHNAVNEQNRRIKEIFTNAMPNFIKRKLLDQNEAATVQDLCTVARRQMVFFELCPSDDWTRDAFNEVSSTLSENLVGALTKLTQQQDELKQQQTDLSNRINSLNFPSHQNSNTSNNGFNPSQRGNYRFNNQRGFRGRGYANNRGRGSLNNNRGFFNGNQNRTDYSSYPNYNSPHIQEASNQEHIAETTYSKQICYICGYPNHYARDCNKGRPANRNQQIPYQTAPKNE